MVTTPPISNTAVRQDQNVEALRVILLSALTLSSIYLCWKLTKPFVNAFTWAFALAVACAPLRKWLFARTQKLLGTLMILSLVVIVIAAPVTFILHQLFQESVRAQSLLRDSIDDHAWPILAWADKQFDLREIAQQIAAAMARGIAPALAHSLGVISQAGVALLSLFFFLRDQETVVAAIRRLLPLSTEEMDLLLTRVSSAVRSSVYGRLSIGLLQGSLGGVVFALVGLPAPMFWAAVMSLLSILPMLGAFVVWVPAGVYLLISGYWIRAVIVVAWGFAIIHPVDNVLYPVLVGARLGLHPLVLFVAFVGGLIAFGPAGLVLGPCIIAAAAGIIEIWEARQCRPSR